MSFISESNTCNEIEGRGALEEKEIQIQGYKDIQGDKDKERDKDREKHKQRLSPKRVTFGQAVIIGYQEPECNPISDMLSEYNDDDIKIFLRMSLTKILLKSPGVSQYDGEKYNPIWKAIISVFAEYDNLNDNIHDTITELCPWYTSPDPDKKWKISHFKKLVEDTSCSCDTGVNKQEATPISLSRPT
mmetsp:Transcript_4037/g.6258  ORF Transcript_4037/g.6258 Transcript_4037/m.6258 type:complete len:188 (-) Transcript_4037:219-782(-)